MSIHGAYKPVVGMLEPGAGFEPAYCGFRQSSSAAHRLSAFLL